MKNNVVFICTLYILICVTLVAGSCNVTYFGSMGGVIASPGFPFKYTPHIDCEYKIIIPYTISTPRNHSILCFRFQRFDLEAEHDCGYDYLSLNGLKFCGSGEISQAQNTSVGYPLTVWDKGLCWRIDYDCWPHKTFDITFHSDPAIVGKGFYATFFIKQDRCYFPCVTDSSLFKSSITCPNSCPSGYMNENGCQTCKCKPNDLQEAPCKLDQYTCFDRQCIPANGSCDRNRTKDCADYSDEIQAHAMCSDRVDRMNHSITCSFTGSLCAWYSRTAGGRLWKREYYKHYYSHRNNYYVAPALTFTMEEGKYLGRDFSPAELKVDLDRYAYTDHSKIRCMSFWYYIPQILSLDIDIDNLRRSWYDMYFKLETNSGSHYLWKRNLLKNFAKKDENDETWHEGMFEIPPTVNITTAVMSLGLEWLLVIGEDNYQTHRIAIDDISILNGKCWPSSDLSCTFIQPGFCNWVSESTGKWLPHLTNGNPSMPWHSASSLFGPAKGCDFAGVSTPGGMGCAYVTFSPENGTHQTRSWSNILFGTPIGVLSSETSCLRFKYRINTTRYYNAGIRAYIFYYDYDQQSWLNYYVWNSVSPDYTHHIDHQWYDAEVEVNDQRNGPFRIGVVAYRDNFGPVESMVMISDISFVNASCSMQKADTILDNCASWQFSCGAENKFSAVVKCIDISRKCDTKVDCADGRDESYGICNTTGLKKSFVVEQIAAIIILVICSFGTLVLFILLVKLLCNCAERSHDPFVSWHQQESTESEPYSVVYNAARNQSEAVVGTSVTDTGSGYPNDSFVHDVSNLS